MLASAGTQVFCIYGGTRYEPQVYVMYMYVYVYTCTYVHVCALA